MSAVLLVEDEAQVAEMIAEALADAGFDVITALNDKAAYAALEDGAEGFAALVADINLGFGTTGFDVAREARRRNAALKVIYITGYAAHVDRFGVEDGVIVPKPFNAAELAARVAALVREAEAGGPD